jgi:cytochrome c biogenesis protein CcmG, thiol:disulfide interchange protein DsbE
MSALLICVGCSGMALNTQGKPSVDFRLQDLNDNVHDLDTYTGQVVLLDLWASWCSPCRAALPFYGALQKKYRTEGFSVIAVSLDEERSELDAFVQEFFKGKKPPFVILHDAEASLAKQISIDTMPTSLLLDRNGKTVYFHAGFNEASDPALIEAEIQKAIAQ